MARLLGGLALAMLWVMLVVGATVAWHSRQPPDAILIDEPDAGPGVLPAAHPVTCMPVINHEQLGRRERPRQEVRT